VKAKVTRVMGSLTVSAPVNYRLSVLVKLVAIDSETEQRQYAWWVAAGREDAEAVPVSFTYTGEDVLRIDVPEGAPISTDYLNEVLAAWKDPTLPPDTPVVKG
jgi:hypothetical protein